MEERKPQPNRVVKPQLHETPAVEGLGLQLRHLRDILTQPEFHTAMQQHGRGKLTVQEKLTLLFDAGTFVEDLAPNPDLGPRHGARRLVTGHGCIQGRLVAAALFDASIAAGAVTVATGQKLLAQMQWAEAQPCPLIIDWDSGGADINDGVVSLDIVRQIFTQVAEISGRIPTLSLITGLNAGVGAYAPVMTDTVIMVDGSMMAVTGPRVIKVATGEEVTPEEMGGAQLHSEKSGEAHYRVPNYQAAARVARQYLSYLPQSMWSFTPCTTSWDKQAVLTDLQAVLTQAQQNARCKRSASWDVRTFIAAAVDDDTWFEYHEKFATSAVVGFARIAGIAVAVIANQRLSLGGAMTAACSAKITRFLRLANTYHLPVITLVDVPGFIATRAESEGQILSKGAHLLMMYPNVMVPRISVVIDKAFGGAYCAMDSITTSVRSSLCRHYGFTRGQIAVMGKEAGPFFTYGPDGGDPAVRAHLQERYEHEYLNMHVAFAARLVAPLEPGKLRQRLVEDVSQLYAEYQVYWQALVHELAQVQAQCPHLYRELRYGAIRGLIQPL
jgi:propionyl-CoA carboxylase beta chain